LVEGGSGCIDFILTVPTSNLMAKLRRGHHLGGCLLKKPFAVLSRETHIYVVEAQMVALTTLCTSME
jgi:hypothetical protein